MLLWDGEYYFPVLYSKTLFIHPTYNGLHPAVPNAHSIPPLPCPLANPRSVLYSLHSQTFQQSEELNRIKGRNGPWC